MKNLIVSFEKLPTEILTAMKTRFPDGWDSETFDFRMPTNNEVFTALRFSTDSANYVIKLQKKKLDRIDMDDL